LGSQFDLDLTSDCRRHIALDRQNVSDPAFILACPEVRLIAYLNQLCRDAYSPACTEYAAFQHARNPKLLTDTANTLAAPFVAHCRRARDHSEPLRIQLAELRDHFFRQSVAEVLLSSGGAQVLKWEYR
jgi:hypothetical protein